MSINKIVKIVGFWEPWNLLTNCNCQTRVVLCFNGACLEHLQKALNLSGKRMMWNVRFELRTKLHSTIGQLKELDVTQRNRQDCWILGTLELTHKNCHSRAVLWWCRPVYNLSKALNLAGWWNDRVRRFVHIWRYAGLRLPFFLIGTRMCAVYEYVLVTKNGHWKDITRTLVIVCPLSYVLKI
jgi:hypothetical protein